MKKSFIFVLAMFAVVAISPHAWAFGSASQADSVADSTAESSSTFNDYSSSEGVRPHMTLIPVPLPNSLPPIYKNGGWKIWDDAYFTQNPITIQMMDNMRRSSLKEYINAWCKLEVEGAAEAPLSVLTEMPAEEKFAPREDNRNWKIMGMVTVRGRTEANIEEAIFEALYHAKKEMNAKRVLVMYRTQLVTTGKVMSLGTIVGASSIFSKSGSPDGIVAGLVGGSGIGKSDSYVDTRPFIKVIVFN